jgi:hypothetical protein
MVGLVRSEKTMSKDSLSKHLENKILGHMWNKIIDKECLLFINKAMGEDEDEHIMQNFIGKLKENVKDYKVLIVLSTEWFSYEDTKQANLAIHHVGWFHAGRFIALMDYLSSKFMKGELQ